MTNVTACGILVVISVGETNDAKDNTHTHTYDIMGKGKITKLFFKRKII